MEGRRRPLVRAAEQVERAGNRQIVDVVTGRLGERTALTPPGHASINQSRIFAQAFAGSNAQSFHEARAKALDEAVALPANSQDGLDGGGVLEIERQGAPATC